LKETLPGSLLHRFFINTGIFLFLRKKCLSF